MTRLPCAFFLAAALLAQDPARLAECEAQLAKQPDNIQLRSDLIRDYFRTSRQDPAADKARTTHIVWLVVHSPESEILGAPAATVDRPGDSYEVIKNAWLAQTSEPAATPQVLSNASNFFRPLDPTRAIELAAKARSLDPKNWQWTYQLAELYTFQIAGVRGLNQNGLPIDVDAAKVDGADAMRIKAMLLGSKDAELVAAVAASLQLRGAIAAHLAGRQDEVAAFGDQLLQHGQEIDPANARWHEMRAQAYAQRAELTTGEAEIALVRRAVAEYDAASAVSHEPLSACFPSKYARMAIEAGELDKAEAAARRCLAEVPELEVKDLNIHESNLILGRAALRRGDLKRAGEYLLTAAHVSEAGSLSSFGPNMMLAKELLQKGQYEVVLEYFNLCGKFWSDDRGQLARWTADVKASRIPEFGANLIY